ncbi:hypothetical protein CTA2_2026 [Colletotrichum tanaceti]|uniref:Uncharacterized protein n=1 Tax=Colletotrichum tanaceti TaxID=1306861 RepID=A0A4U6XNJ2_9PEZI|nr:hypothetical protein CTA2_2026 [Colletotrichum tanaceti]TKW57129.1 hypothetical protein CTA1_7953 [Colletotrichum tanaceti]
MSEKNTTDTKSATGPEFLGNERNKPTPEQIINLMQLYTEKMKYGGGMYDVLDLKLNIFRDICDKVGIPSSNFAGAFSMMLKGRALDFYYYRLCEVDVDSPRDFLAMVRRVREYFETQDRLFQYDAEWNNISLRSIILENPRKTTAECFELLLDKLYILNGALNTERPQTHGILRYKVLIACKGVEECKLCLFKPAPTFEGVCSQLRSSIGIISSETQ